VRGSTFLESEGSTTPLHSLRMRRKFGRARRLRATPTDAERKLWQQLRNRQLAGQKFRRQVPFGPYVVDFYCHEARLVIEVDGSQHDCQQAYDERRTAFLQSQRIRVIRFWNNEVLLNMEGVLTVVLDALRWDRY